MYLWSLSTKSYILSVIVKQYIDSHSKEQDDETLVEIDQQRAYEEEEDKLDENDTEVSTK